LTTLYSFGTVSDPFGHPAGGIQPRTGLLEGSDSNLYGQTSSEPYSDNYGTFFRITMGPTVPVFQAVSLANGMLSMTWNTEAGGTYQVQYNSSLSSSKWVNLGSAFTATGITLNATDSLTNGPQRFYRLVLLP